MGFIEIYNNPRLLIAVLTNTQARMNTIIITLFLNLWAKKFYDNKEAFSKAQMISGIASTVGLISSVLFGFIFDKARNSTLLFITNGACLLGYLSLTWLNINNSLCTVSFVLIGFGFYGLTTVGFVILNKNVGHQARGSVMGVNSFCGAIGIVILTKLGGYLFNKASYLAPFYMVGTLSLISILLLLITPIREKINKDFNPHDVYAYDSKPTSNESESINKNVRTEEV